MLLGTDRLCEARWVFVGDDVDAFRDVYLRALIAVQERHRVEGRILDLGGGVLWSAIGDAALEPGEGASEHPRLGKTLARDLKLLVATPDDGAAALRKLLSDSNPATRPHQVICALRSVDAPLSNAIQALIGPQPRPGAGESHELRMGILEDSAVFSERLGREVTRLFDSGVPSCLVRNVKRWSPVLGDLLARSPRTFGLIVLSENGTGVGAGQPYSRSPSVPIQVAMAGDEAERFEDAALVIRRSPSLAGSGLLPVPQHYQAIEEYESRVIEWWRQAPTPILALTGLAGSGKTTLAQHFVRRVATRDLLNEIEPALVLAYDFYRSRREVAPTVGEASTGSSGRHAEDPHGAHRAASDRAGDQESEVASCIVEVAEHLTGGPFPATPLRHLERISAALERRRDTRVLLLLDGVERIAIPMDGRSGEYRWPQLLLDLLRRLGTRLRVMITSRAIPRSIPPELSTALTELALPSGLPPEAAAALLRACGVSGEEADLKAVATDKTGRNPLLTYHLGRYLRRFKGGDPRGAAQITPAIPERGSRLPTGPTERLNLEVVGLYGDLEEELERSNGGRVQLARRLAALESGTRDDLRDVFLASSHPRARGELGRMTMEDLETQLDDLASLGLVTAVGDPGVERRYVMHPVVAQYFRFSLFTELDPGIESRPLPTRRPPGPQVVRTRGSLTRGPLRVRGASSGPQAPEPAAPVEPAALDAIEEILERMVEVGLRGAARRLFEEDVGGAEHLRSLGDEERARRILHILERADG